MIITRKHLPRRTFLRAWARPSRCRARRDDAGVRGAGRARVARPTRLAFTYVPNGITMADWTPTATGAAFEFTRVLKPLEAVPGGHAGALGPRAQERRRARRRPRRSRPRRRVVPDRRPPAQDRRRRHPERHLGRSDRGAAPRPTRRASRRSSSAATTRGRSATATPATRAPTPTAWPGADRRRRCRRRRTRASSSSACSATSTPACRRTSARGACSIAAASSIWSSSGRRSWPPTSGPSDRRKLDEYLTSIREIERRIEMAEQDLTGLVADDRQADRHPGAVRRLREPDVRPAGGRVPDRPHARRHDDDGTRRQHADLSGDRRARSAPSADAPPRQPRVDREGHARSTRCTWSCSPASSTS